MTILIVALVIAAAVAFLLAKSGKVKDDNNNGIPDVVEKPVVKAVEEVKEVVEMVKKVSAKKPAAKKSAAKKSAKKEK